MDWGTYDGSNALAVGDEVEMVAVAWLRNPSTFVGAMIGKASVTVEKPKTNSTM